MDTLMFFLHIYDTYIGIMFILPAMAVVLFTAFLLAHFWNKRKNKLSPGKIEEEKLNNFKFLARVFGIIALVTIALAVGATTLLFIFDMS